MNVVIVGASSGIGRLIAETYINRGDIVGIAARRLESLNQLKDLAPERVKVESIDVNDSSAPDKLLTLIESIGGADIIYNVAGVGFANMQMDLAKDLSIVSTNCYGFTQIVNTAYRYFLKSGRKGQIAAVSSIAATNGLGMAAAYSASKSYQQRYLTALRQLVSMQKADIYITDIRPGFIDTDLLDHARKYPMLMKPGYAAAKIVRAVDRHRRVAVIDWKWNLVVGLWRLIPNCIWTRLGIVKV